MIRISRLVCSWYLRVGWHDVAFPHLKVMDFTGAANDLDSFWLGSVTVFRMQCFLYLNTGSMSIFTERKALLQLIGKSQSSLLGMSLKPFSTHHGYLLRCGKNKGEALNFKTLDSSNLLWVWPTEPLVQIRGILEMQKWQCHILQWPFLIVLPLFRIVTDPSHVIPSLHFRKIADFSSLGVLGCKRRNFSHPTSPLTCCEYSEMEFRPSFPDLLVLNSVKGPRLVALNKYTIIATLISKHTVIPEKWFTWEKQSTFSEEDA